MIILDTNVVSETMKPEPNERVRAWLDSQPEATLFFTSITLAELLYGVAAMPIGRRRTRLDAFMSEFIEQHSHRALAFDFSAARKHALLAVRAKQRGRGFPVPDGYIAAIAAAHGFTVATRDTAPFAAAGLSVINPWEFDANEAG